LGFAEHTQKTNWYLWIW